MGENLLLSDKVAFSRVFEEEDMFIHLFNRFLNTHDVCASAQI